MIRMLDRSSRETSSKLRQIQNSFRDMERLLYYFQPLSQRYGAQDVVFFKVLLLSRFYPVPFSFLSCNFVLCVSFSCLTHFLISGWTYLHLSIFSPSVRNFPHVWCLNTSTVYRISIYLLTYLLTSSSSSSLPSSSSSSSSSYSSSSFSSSSSSSSSSFSSFFFLLLLIFFFLFFFFFLLLLLLLLFLFLWAGRYPAYCNAAYLGWLY
jgi:hypothetical protein